MVPENQSIMATCAVFARPKVTQLTEPNTRVKLLEGNHFARVAELADARDLGSRPERGAGSTPVSRITLR